MTFKKIVKGIFSFVSVMCVYMFCNARKRNIIYHQFTAEDAKQCPTQLTVFFISDIHRRKIDRKLLEKIQSTIDLVVIGGDLAEKGVPLSRISKNVGNLTTLGPTFFIWGNNDREAGEDAIRKILIENKVYILENENIPIPNHPSWGICGTDDPSSGQVNFEATLNNIEQYKKVLLVTHQPQVIYKMEKFHRPTLSLAGHTHGGQIRIGCLGLLEKGAFKKSEDHAQLISNGYGTSTLPFRLGADPECHIITIQYGG